MLKCLLKTFRENILICPLFTSANTPLNYIPSNKKLDSILRIKDAHREGFPCCFTI